MPEPTTEPTPDVTTDPAQEPTDVTAANPEAADDQAIAEPPPADPQPAAPRWFDVQLGDDAGYTPSTIHGTLTADRAIKLNRLVNGFAQQGITVSHFEALGRLLDLI